MTCFTLEKTGGLPPVFFARVMAMLAPVASVSVTTLQAISDNAELREPLVLLVIADPVGHWYKGDTAA
ncbi:hypothetical protein [Dyella humicola]|uniref:hypothetical protein n=1 Tax=Dyella humicola TaxID=2992126 RepID=UPI00224DD640|nr:hypothetical protein [Dyella humicola]